MESERVVNSCHIDKVSDQLAGTFFNWIGDARQLDDVLLIGMNI